MIGGDIGTYGFEDIVQLNDILLEARRQSQMANEALVQCNKKQEDLLHEIEFGDHKNRELARLAKELKEVRMRRRVAKNTIAVVDPILRWQDNNATAFNRISTAIGAARKIDDEQKTAVYYKRASDSFGERIEH